MANELPNLSADIVLEFQQSLNNITLFGEAMETLDRKFLNTERRIDSMRSSLSSLASQVSRGSGQNLRNEIEREINNLVQANGIAVANFGGKPLKINARTVQNVFSKVDKALNDRLATAYSNIVIDINPNLQVGKVPIQKDDLDEVNKAIARLVRVQLNNLVGALRKHGAGLISAQDLSSLQFHIGKETVQQIVNKVRDHIKSILMNPNVATGSTFNVTERDMDKVFRAIKGRIGEAIDGAVAGVNARQKAEDLAPSMARIHEAIDRSAKDYIRNVTNSINAVSNTSFEKPINQVSNQLKRFMAKELGAKDLDEFNRMFANQRFSLQDLNAAELRRQFARLEQALNRKIGGGMNEEVSRIVRSIESVEISYSPRLHQHLVREINRINNQIVKKIREQIDVQFAHMRAEINSVQVSPKDINRARKVRDMGRLDYSEAESKRVAQSVTERKPLINDPYGRRDAHFNTFGLEGAITNTFRHILAGSVVGAPMMLLYKSFEQYRTSQLEQLKMFSNFFAKAITEPSTIDTIDKTPTQVAQETIRSILPFVKDTAQFYAIDYGSMTQVASVGSRLLNTEAEVKTFTDVVAKIYNIDREGDVANTVAPGLEAFMGQFGLMVHELEQRVALPLAVATNVTNATTEGIMNAMARSGSSFHTAGVDPEQAIAMVAASIRYTGLSGENIGNFYKSILPRLKSPNALKELESIGINVYDVRDDGTKIARSAKEILDDVAEKYNRLDDAKSRDVIMNLFGTYQSSKGTTTLMEFEEIKEIMEGIKEFTPEHFAALMQANATSPIMEIQRAGVSVTLALVDVIEELTPEIVAVSKAITELSSGIRDHKEALGNFITFLGNALLGYATMYGVKRLNQAAGVPGAVARTQAVDTLLGNRGVLGRGKAQGVLLTNFGSLTTQGALENSGRNRAALNRAMNNPTTAPLISYLTTMNKQQIGTMQAYMRDNNLRAKSIKDLAIIAQESKEYVAKKALTPEQIWSGSMYSARNLYRKGMAGLDENFARTLASDLQDKKKFDSLANTNQGRRVTAFLAGLDENEMKKFQSHLDDINRRTGKTVSSIGGLTYAMNTYTKAQAISREEMRKANPHYSELSRNMDKVVTSLSSPDMQRGVRNMDTFLGSISTKARGAATAFAGLARTVGGFAAQLALMAGVGWTIGSVSEAMSYHTEDEKIIKRGEKQLQDIQAYKEYSMKGPGGQIMSGTWAELKGLADFVVFWDDAFTDMGDMREVQKELIAFLEENKGMPAWAGASDGRNDVRVRDFLNQFNKEEQEQIWQEFIADDGNKKLVEEARSRIFQEQLRQRAKESQEAAALEEGVTLEEAERRRRELMKGSYRFYDLETVKKDIQDRIQELTVEYTLQQISAIDKGYASDSVEFMQIRQEMSRKIVELYQEQLDFIAKTVEDLTEELKRLKAEGAPEEEIRRAQDDLNRWKHNQEKAGGELRIAQDQARKEQIQADFDAAMSRISRAASEEETNRAIQEAINSATMDRNSKEYIDATVKGSRERINSLNAQIEQLASAAMTPDQKQQVDAQVGQIKSAIEQERVRIRDLQLSSIGLYKQDLQDTLAELSNEYLQARVDAGAGVDENSPFLRGKRIEQYNKQVSLFDSVISDLQKQLNNTSDPEGQKNIQREIRDLQRQSLQAQLGILDEMKNTGGTFNLPDNVKAMSYYEYITRNNTHSTYTVQGGDTFVSVTLPNITDGTSTERIRQMGKAFGQGIHEGKSLRLQKQANPFGYKG